MKTLTRERKINCREYENCFDAQRGGKMNCYNLGYRCDTLDEMEGDNKKWKYLREKGGLRLVD